MKALILGVATLLGGSPVLAAEPSPACLAKRAEIEQRLAQAQSQGQGRELKGLKRASQANRAHCTNASLEAERSQAIAEASKKVAERQAELDEAQHKGDQDKISKRRAKVEEARLKLSEAERPLPQ